MSKFPVLKKGRTSVNDFNLVGTAVINDYTFNMDRTTDKSDWQWNTLNLGVKCGDCGTIYADMNGGFGTDRDNLVYNLHGKKDVNGKMRDDFTNRYNIAWEDRFNEDILEDVGDFCFINVGIEVDVEDKLVVKKFLHEYDAIKYLQEHLETGMVLNIKGDLEYQEYQGETQIDKTIRSIFLSKKEPEDYRAWFRQSILCEYGFLDKLDKEAGTYGLNAYVVDYVGKHMGKPIRQNFSYDQRYEFQLLKGDEDGERTRKTLNKYFKPRKKTDICEINVEGKITKNGTTTEIKLTDVPEEIQELIDLGLYTKEDIMTKATTGGGNKETYLIEKPVVKMVDNDGVKTPVIQYDKKAWTIESLNFFSSLDMDNVSSAKPKKTATKKKEEEDSNDVSDDFDLDDLFD